MDTALNVDTVKETLQQVSDKEKFSNAIRDSEMAAMLKETDITTDQMQAYVIEYIQKNPNIALTEINIEDMLEQYLDELTQ